MSRVDRPYECTCDCHTSPGVVHFAPCCQGQCDRCGVYVTNQKKHQALCRQAGESPGDLRRRSGGKPRHQK